MLFRSRTRAITLLTAGLLLSPGLLPAHAQQTPGRVMSASPDKRNAWVEQRITKLHADLKITPEQEKPFDDFAGVMRQNASQMNSAVEKGTGLPTSATAVERLQAYTDMAQTHAQNMQQLSSAFSTFYGTLTPQQKKLADTSFAREAQARRSAGT